jgi:hypothetical protein
MLTMMTDQTTDQTADQTRREAAARLGAVIPWRPSEAAIRAAVEQLAAVQRRARERRLDESDVRAAVARYADVLALAEAHGWSAHTVHVWVSGGCVPHSYAYRADATWLHVEATRPVHVPGAQVPVQTGLGGIRATRDRADSRPHGRGPTWRASVDVGDCTIRPEIAGVTPRLERGVLRWVW